MCKQLSRSGLADSTEAAWRRVVIEKPFGHDLGSAQELNGIVNDVFPEESVFRIDHYLGKETVQNLLALRFANELFEPIWNSHHVDHVQITMAEDIGVGGRGRLLRRHRRRPRRHPEPPAPAARPVRDGGAAVVLPPHDLREEKIKVLSATNLADPIDETTARGQYAGGWQGSSEVKGLQQEDGFPSDSVTETLRRDHLRGEHPPMGRGAVLPAHGQAAGPAGHRDRHRVQARPAPAVSTRR